MSSTELPKIVYEPRFWKGRVWIKGGPIAGVGFLFRCPYGVATNVSVMLTRQATLGQIARFTFGPVPGRQLTAMAKEVKNSPELRFEEVLGKLGSDLGINWEA